MGVKGSWTFYKRPPPNPNQSQRDPNGPTGALALAALGGPIREDIPMSRIRKALDLLGDDFLPKLYDEQGRKIRQIHGRTKDRAFGVWRHMIGRCYSPRVLDYRWYGARGITVCDEWHDANAFCDWAHANGYSSELTLERIDNDGSYCPENCRWATMVEQNRNRRSTHWVDIDGMRMSLIEAAHIYGKSRTLVGTRLAKGWTLERALTQPQRVNGP